MFLHTFNNILLLVLTIRGAQKVEKHKTKQKQNTQVSKVTYQLVHKYKFPAETLTKG